MASLPLRTYFGGKGQEQRKVFPARSEVLWIPVASLSFLAVVPADHSMAERKNTHF